MSVSIRGVKVKLHPLTIITLALFCFTGMPDVLLPLAIALAAHEMMHMFVALAFNVRVSEIDVMPFGAAIRLESLYTLPGYKLSLIALAGPAGNFMCIMAACAMAYRGAVSAQTALTFIDVNYVLMAFNLLPAMPLDGGRIALGVMSAFMPRRSAFRCVIASGYAVSAALAGTALAGVIMGGRLNISLIIASVFVLASAARERRYEMEGEAEGTLIKLGGARLSRPEKLNTIAVEANEPLLNALNKLEADKEYLIAVFEAGKLLGVIDRRGLAEALQSDRSVCAYAAVRHV